jgi:copper(I)-binding protein
MASVRLRTECRWYPRKDPAKVSRAQYSVSAQSPEQSSPAPVGIARRRVLTRFAPAVAGLGIAVLLVGCGAGQITQTDTQQSAVNGGSGQVGAIAIRNAELQWPDNPQGVYAPGSSATLIVTIANTGIDPDELVAVSSPAASSVTIDGSDTGTKPLPGNFSIVSGVDVDDSTEDVPLPSTTTSAPASTTTTETSGSQTSGSQTSSTKTSGKAPATTTTTKAAPALPPGTVKIVLNGLRTINGQPLRAGLTIPITFTFARAGQCTIAEVPIAAAPDQVRLNTSDDMPSGNN